MKKFSLIAILVLSLFACREEKDTMTITPPEPNITVSASVIGSVTDNMGNPLEDALVTFKNLSTTTDERGIFAFTDVTLYQDGTFIKVTKDGYFHGSRRFYADVQNTSHVKIQLIQKELTGTVVSASGGKTTFNDASVDFPANGFVTENGSDYNGTVNVYAHWLNPSLPSTFKEMPGDLVGVASDNEEVALATYGMIAVELEDSAGNSLQLKESNPASIRMPVPQSLLNSAPSEIPLWHFDEDAGYWIEEGSATLVNGYYEGTVSHFSFWNCDAPFPLVNLDGTVLIDGLGLEDVLIKITDVNSGFSAIGYTTNRGYFAGKVPQEKPLLIEVFDKCGNVIYSTTISPLAADHTLPTINGSSNNILVTLSGTLTNCQNLTIDEGYVVVEYATGPDQVISTSTGGTYSSTFLHCQGTDVLIYGVDLTNDLISTGNTMTLTGNTILDIEACDTYEEERTIFDYIGSDWDSQVPGSQIISTVDITWFIDKTLYTITSLNWDTNDIAQTMIEHDLGATTASYVYENNDGFSATGTTDFVPQIIPNGVQLSLIDVTTDITVTDPLKFDPAITEVGIELVVNY